MKRTRLARTSAQSKPHKAIKLEENELEPPLWREVVARVRDMRSKQVAPVDTMGCSEAPDRTADQRTQRFHLLVSLMLSSQTKDQITAEAHARLRSTLPGGLTVKSVLATPEDVLDKLIWPVGFHKRKSQYILRTCQILKDKYDGDIPEKVEDMLQLPGVGPKMAYLLRSGAWGKVEGIGVDVHVHRLSNLWQWVPDNCDTPEKTRLALQKWLPQELWQEINPLLVGFGQTVCLPQKPRCSQCSLTSEMCQGRAPEW